MPETVHIDGFNTVITLEVALSGSPVFYCRDVALRDLAGLRGTYRVIDKTQTAIELLLRQLELLYLSEAVFYLDAPVSNSGRLSGLIRQCAKGYGISVQTQIIPGVDRILEQMEGVISGDAMAVSVYMTPEELWEYDLVISAYKETPETSRERIYRRVMEQYPNVSEKQIKTLMK